MNVSNKTNLFNVSPQAFQVDVGEKNNPEPVIEIDLELEVVASSTKVSTVFKLV